MLNQMQIEFGEKVRKSRISYGLSQERTAEILGISPVTFRKIEQGKGTPSWDLYIQLVIMFKIDTSEFRRKYVAPYLIQRSQETNIDIFIDCDDE